MASVAECAVAQCTNVKGMLQQERGVEPLSPLAEPSQELRFTPLGNAERTCNVGCNFHWRMSKYQSTD